MIGQQGLLCAGVPDEAVVSNANRVCEIHDTAVNVWFLEVAKHKRSESMFYGAEGSSDRMALASTKPEANLNRPCGGQWAVAFLALARRSR